MRQGYRKLLFTGCVTMLVGVAAIACTDFSHPPDALGRITVSVVDSATNVGVGTLTATLFLEDKTTKWREIVTSTDGTGEFGTKDGGIIPGKFLVFLSLTGKGYQLAAGEENYKPARSTIGQTDNVSFKLHKGTVTVPPGS